MGDGEPPTAHTKHGDLTLDEIGEMQPGMARLMLEVSERFWILYYAAKGGNWELAKHEFSETRKTLRIAGVVRPKYTQSLAEFEGEELATLEASIAAQDWDAFAVAYRDAVDASNELHRLFGYAYIEWQVPDSPPPYLRVTPVES
jgi:hypothetical protein